MTGSRQIVLAGQMGAGKTTLGRLLAARLELPLCDSDAALLESEGASAGELQRHAGRSALHLLEAEHLLRALAEPRAQVICAAASTIDDDRCLAALASPAVTLLWLRAAPSTLASRHARGSHRPPAVPDAVRRGRDARLASLRPVILDSDEASPDRLLEEALAAIGR